MITNQGAYRLLQQGDMWGCACRWNGHSYNKCFFKESRWKKRSLYASKIVFGDPSMACLDLKLQENKPTTRRIFMFWHGSRVQVCGTKLPIFSPWKQHGHGGPRLEIHHVPRRSMSWACLKEIPLWKCKKRNWKKGLRTWRLGHIRLKPWKIISLLKIEWVWACFFRVPENEHGEGNHRLMEPRDLVNKYMDKRRKLRCNVWWKISNTKARGWWHL